MLDMYRSHGMNRPRRCEIARTSAGMAAPRRMSYDCDDNKDTRGSLCVSLSFSSSCLPHRPRWRGRGRGRGGLAAAMASLHRDASGNWPWRRRAYWLGRTRLFFKVGCIKMGGVSCDTSTNLSVVTSVCLTPDHPPTRQRLSPPGKTSARHRPSYLRK